MQELTISFLYEKLEPAEETVRERESDEFFQGIPGSSPHATGEWKCSILSLNRQGLAPAYMRQQKVLELTELP